MIGIFDSGIGGLSLYKKAKKAMSDKTFIYLADQDSFPYGEKSEKELRALTRKNIKLLENLGAKVVLIACNSATVSSRDRIRREFDIPLVGVEPAVKVVHDLYSNKKALVLATDRTSRSHLKNKAASYGNVKIIGANGLVSLIEEKFPNIQASELKNILDNKIDGEEVIVLGCTHYHLIQKILESIYPDKIFIAPEEAVIKQLSKFSDLATGSGADDIFLTTGDLAGFQVKLEAIIGRKCDVRKI